MNLFFFIIIQSFDVCFEPKRSLVDFSDWDFFSKFLEEAILEFLSENRLLASAHVLEGISPRKAAAAVSCNLDGNDKEKGDAHLRDDEEEIAEKFEITGKSDITLRRMADSIGKKREKVSERKG